MSAFSQAFSAALVDFLWQGAIVGLLLWLALAALRNRSANARYAVSCAALFALSVLPLLTMATLWTMSGSEASASLAPPVPPALLAPPAHDMPQTMLQIWFVPETPRIAWLEGVQRWALPFWLLGVLLFSVRLASGWLHSLSLRRGAALSEQAVLSLVADLAVRIGIDRPIRVLASSVADGPSVVGWLRPAILLPPATMMGLTVQQLEAVLAHELAHVKRHDYAVNLMQIVAETLFFYHPVVWWISKQIRIERELCCDDIAVRSCGDAVGYARALTSLARQRLTVPELSVAATGGSLKYRVQRLLGATPRELGPSGAAGVIVLAVAIASMVLNIDRLQALAHTQNPEQPRFEVASVKRNTRNDRIISFESQGGRFTAIGNSLGGLLRAAYQVQEYQIVGGPDWIDSDRFDIVATYPSGVPLVETPGSAARQRDLMIRSLLEDRFQLAMHKETRERPVYALVRSRTDGTLGPQLRRANDDCASRRTADCGTAVGPGYVRVRGVTIAQLATAFSRLTNTGSSLGRLVVDRSGLEGFYDGELRFTPENIPDIGPNPPPFLPAIDRNGPSIFTAIQEQFGLKLDAQRGPVEVLVIDRVERPTPD